eukprot:m51a1_g13229 hypothetical protein (191) ;mRNA; f:1748-2608
MPQPTGPGAPPSGPATPRARRGPLTGTPFVWSTGRPITNFSFIVGSQIRFLVQSLKKGNYKSTVAELHQLASLYGHDAYLYMMRCLVEFADGIREKLPKEHQSKANLLREQLVLLASQGNFSSVLQQVLDGVLEPGSAEEWISSLARALRLPPAAELAVCLALAQHPSDAALAAEGLRALKRSRTRCCRS